MKRVYAILAFLLVFSAGCEDEEEVKLSGFIIGEWDSELTAINPGSEDQVLVYFYAEFLDTCFNLDFLTYPEKLPMYNFEDLDYTINNEFNLTIDNPMVPGETVDFNIVWNSGYDKMVWVPVPVAEENPPTIVFTKR
jgi:hypothetical protein